MNTRLMKNMKKKKKGFTLIELIIVIAILAILAALALPKFGAVKNTANRSADLATAKNIESTIAKGIADDKILIGSGTARTGVSVTTNLGTTTNTFTVAGNIDGSTDPKLKDAAGATGTFSIDISDTGDVTIYRSTTADEAYPHAAGMYNPS
jgi:type IV pilus assembly protein PilA